MNQGSVTKREELLGALSDRTPSVSVELVRRALDIAGNDANDGVEAALLLAPLGVDDKAIAACILSYVASSASSFDVETISRPAPEGFGDEVGRLLESVRRLEGVRWNALGRESPETLRRMFIAMAADVRVVLIVLAIRLRTMRTLRRRPEAAVRERLAQETQTVFAPLANRLGIAQIKWELEDLSLRELEPEVYAELKTSLAEKRSERNAYIDEVMAVLRNMLAEHHITADVTGRPKHIYSIYKKMRRKDVGFEEIYDVSALRVLVDRVEDCYATLGIVHGSWVPIPGEFDDYIARPKANFYQSLHTAVVGPDGKSVEIQVRTHEMHRYAEFGVAAHWAYKEGRKGRSADEQFNLMRQLMSWQTELSEEDQAALEQDVFADRVYVLTPGGDIIDLPAGATPLDFAYRVHTMVGHRCRGAKINGQIVPLDHRVQTGDRIEILTRKHPEPSRDWLIPTAGYLETAGARQKVRQWFRQQGREDSVIEGRKLLERELARITVEPPSDEVLMGLADDLNLDGIDDLLAAIGFGDVGAHTIASRVQKLTAPEPEVPVLVPERIRGPKKKRKTAAGVSLDGISDVLSQPARCCRPVPGDAVVGYITRSRGIMIHRDDCPNVRNTREPERFVAIDWGMDGRRTYPVTLRIQVQDRPGAFRQVAEVISNLGVNISASSTRARPLDDMADMNLTLEINTSDQVERLLERLRSLAIVVGVRRVGD